MNHTGLSLGGFTQPCVARNMLEHPANVEKGLCQRFLWLVPEPTTVAFEELQCVDTSFSTAIGKLELLIGSMIVHLGCVYTTSFRTCKEIPGQYFTLPLLNQ